jgi:hypothetical protein
MSRRIECRAEYGSVEYVLFWGFVLDEEKKTLVVTRKDESKTIELSADHLAAFFRDLDKSNLLELPSTDYDVDQTDDLYHMGVSISVFHGNEQRFRHKVPTGQLVMVSTRRLTKKQYLSFALFVQSCAKRAAELSQLSVPDHLIAKWKSRSALDTLE